MIRSPFRFQPIMPNADSGIAGELHSLHLMSNRLLVVSGKLKKTFYWVYLFSPQSSQNVGRMLENLSRILMLFCQCPITRTGILLLPGFMGKIRVFFTIHKKRQKTPPLFQHLICLHPHKRIVIRQFSKRRKKIILRLNA